MTVIYTVVLICLLDCCLSKVSLTDRKHALQWNPDNFHFEAETVMIFNLSELREYFAEFMSYLHSPLHPGMGRTFLYLSSHEGLWKSGGIAPRILNLGTD